MAAGKLGSGAHFTVEGGDTRPTRAETPDRAVTLEVPVIDDTLPPTSQSELTRSLPGLLRFTDHLFFVLIFLRISDLRP